MQTHNATITVPEAATGLEPVWCGVEIVRCPICRRRSSRASRAPMAVESITVAGGRRHASASIRIPPPSTRRQRPRLSGSPRAWRRGGSVGSG